ncbi:MAG: type II toxin-antitoxin system prevent-host-death family antitoxin [Actinobacteria bacterium]|nr:type II toxin-antitoxin system prevent-host-death family antitoxin [Actinomycetota bacterium]
MRLGSTRATLSLVARKITQRELRNESGEIMRGIDRGESYIVTRNGVPIADLVPIERRRFVPKAAMIEAFRGAPAVDLDRLRADIDRWIDPDPTPRV